MAPGWHLKATSAARAKGKQTPGGTDPSHIGSLTSTDPQEALGSVSKDLPDLLQGQRGMLVAPRSLRLGIARI